MTFPKITGARGTSLSTFGGDYLNWLSDYLSGIDVTSTYGRPVILTPTAYRQTALIVQSADTVPKDVQIKGPATIDVNKVANIPAFGAGLNSDDFLMKTVVQAIIGKTIDLNVNVISDSTAGVVVGDILKFDGTEYANFRRGSALQILRVNSAGNNLEWAPLPSNIAYLDAASQVFTQNLKINANSFSMWTLYRPNSTVGFEFGGLIFDADNSTPAEVSYTTIRGSIVANTPGAESGQLRFYTRNAGVLGISAIVGHDGKFFIGKNSRLTLDETGLTTARTFTWPDGTGKVLTEALSQTETNKTIDALQNTLIYVNKYFPHEAYGDYLCISEEQADGRGMLQNMHGYGTLSVFGSANGKSHTWTTSSTINDIAGIVCTYLQYGVTGMNTNPQIRARLTLSKIGGGANDSRFYYGFFSPMAQHLPVTDTPLLSTTPGFLIGWRSTDTNFMIFSSDGTTLMTPVDTGVNIATSGTFYWLEIKVTGGGTSVTWTIYNNSLTVLGTGTINTTIPIATARLNIHAVTHNTTTTPKAVSFNGMWIKADK